MWRLHNRFLKENDKKRQQEGIDAQILVEKLNRTDQWDQSVTPRDAEEGRKEERHFISNFHGKIAVVAKRGELMGATGEQQQQEEEEFKTGVLEPRALKSRRCYMLCGVLGRMLMLHSRGEKMEGGQISK